MATLHLGTETRFLTVELTDEERRFRADKAGELAELSGVMKKQHEERKEEAGRLKKDFEAKSEEAARLIGIYRAGKEDRNVEVRLEYDDISQEVQFIRTDTQDVVESRKPTPEDTRKPTPEDTRKIAAARQTAIVFPKRGRKGQSDTLES